jgi:hypothetical protein
MAMEQESQNTDKGIVSTWLTGRHSCTLIIPLEYAKECGLEQPGQVMVEQKPEGILIKKFNYKVVRGE